MTDTTQWEGHPWKTAEHHTVGPRAVCDGCGAWCSPSSGCWCCNEPACEFLLAEARWSAEDVRESMAALTTDLLLRANPRAVPWSTANWPFLWEAADDD